MKQEQRPSWLSSVSIAALCSWGAVHTWSMLETGMALVPGLLGFVSVMAWKKALQETNEYLKNRHQRRKANASSTSKGSARWATYKEIKKAGYFSQTDGLFFLTHKSGRPIFSNDNEAHIAYIAPTGFGKTKDFVIPNLLHYRGSAIVTDKKYTLAHVTAKARRKKFKHKIYRLDSSGKYDKELGKPSSFNPLCVIQRAWDQKRYGKVVSLVQKLSLQLLPKPKGENENDYFRRGSVKLIIFGVLYLVSCDEPENCTLPELLRLLRNNERLKDALLIASCSDVLRGELADRAADLLPKFETSDTRQMESFREGATQSLEFASPGSDLYESLSGSSFSFRELKEKKITVYINEDNEEYLGLIIWAAIEELKDCGNNKPVLCLLDEFTGFKLHGISQALTEFREYGIRVALVFQELAEYERIYGRAAKETMLSQTSIKFFKGASGTTAEWLSKQLGNTTIKAENFNMGKSANDPVQSSISDQSRPLLFQDELGRFPDGILLINGQFPMTGKTLGYNEADPWKYMADINPLHGKKFKGKTKMTIRY